MWGLHHHQDATLVLCNIIGGMILECSGFWNGNFPMIIPSKEKYILLQKKRGNISDEKRGNQKQKGKRSKGQEYRAIPEGEYEQHRTQEQFSSIAWILLPLYVSHTNSRES